MKGARREKRRLRVLVIDDQPLMLTTLEVTLGAEHDVVTAASAQVALDLLDRDSDFDAVVCDLMMPGTSGMDLYRALEEREQPLVTRLGFMTGGAYTAEARRFLAETGAPTLAKPFETAAICQLVERLAD